MVKKCLKVVFSYETDVRRNPRSLHPLQETTDLSTVILDCPGSSSGLQLIFEPL
jgi:hypothetical protein